ncbi:MAG: hypothetical protein GQ569_05970 [Methylococcaceae bacterium]|nr:hypothetical protein [Methylococcaceae bacterium]
MPPLLPDKDIAARDLWPPKDGRSILANIADKNFQITEPETDSWLVLVEPQWQLFSSKDDLCDSDNAVRQKLFDAVQLQQSLGELISSQRCLAVAETGEDSQWRLWQIVRVEKTLSQLLEKTHTEVDAKKIAAMLFIIANKFVNACQQLSKFETQLTPTLDNLSLQDNKIIFTGFIPTVNSTPAIEIESHITQAFQETITKIANNPAIENAQILQCLTLHASENAEHKTWLNALSKLFKQ